MEPRIEVLTEQKLVGKHLSMSFGNDKTFELWSSFMPRRKEIKNQVSSDLISMQVYHPGFDFKDFDPNIEFEKWAAVEVSDLHTMPDGMAPFVLSAGLYAIFIHSGHPKTAAKTFGYIFGTWLPKSDYVLDNRPHFEILGAKYNNNSDDSEEEVWIPVKQKTPARQL